MGYKNPQRIIDRSFDAFTQASKRWVGQIAKTSSEIHERNAKEKEAQKVEWEKQNEAQQKMYSKVNELGSTGNSALDENLRGFWDNRVDQYFEIKNLMSRGDMDQKEGNKYLAQIMGEVDKFQKVVPYIAQQVALQREHGKIEPGKPGAISSTVPQESQNIFQNLLNGDNTALVEKAGVMYLFNPPMDGEDGQEGAMINLDEMLAKQQTGQDIVQLVPDINKDLEMAYKNIYKPDDAASDYIEVETIDKGGEYLYDVKKYKTKDEDGEFDPKERGMAQMISDNQFGGLLNSEKIMESVWQDMIPDEYIAEHSNIDPDSSWHEVDPENEGEDNIAKKEAAWQQQADLANKWFAEQAYDRNSELDQGTFKHLNKRKKEKPKNISKPKQYGSNSKPYTAAQVGVLKKTAPPGSTIIWKSSKSGKILTYTVSKEDNK